MAGCTVSIYADDKGQISSPHFNVRYDNKGKRIKNELLPSEPKEPWHWRWQRFPAIFELGVGHVGSNGTISASFRHIGDPRDMPPPYQPKHLEVPRTDRSGKSMQCSDFIVEVEPLSGHLYLSAQPGEQYLKAPIKYGEYFATTAGKPDKPAFRIAPICCKQPALWLFLDEDPLAAAINDLRTSKSRSFAGSQHVNRCSRLDEAIGVVQGRIKRIATMNKPVMITARPLPVGAASDWVNANKVACPNLCDHPTICLDTGSCACVASHCPEPKSRRDRPSSDRDQLSLPEAVAMKSHLDVMRSDAKSYLSRNPKFPSVHVTELPESVQEDRKARPTRYDSLLPPHPACYSADSMLERGIKLMDHAYSDNSMVFLPYFQRSLSVSTFV